jgi:hypothetical protein
MSKMLTQIFADLGDGAAYVGSWSRTFRESKISVPSSRVKQYPKILQVLAELYGLRL